MRLFDLTEAPITGFDTVGDFSTPASIRHRVDLRSVTAPALVHRIKRVWERTPVDFNLLFVNQPGMDEYAELGQTDIKWLSTRMPDVLDKLDKTAVNVIYTNNIGDERVSFTPWILAHRFSHAISASGTDPMVDGRIRKALRSLSEFARFICLTVSAFSAVPGSMFKPVFSAIGTMKSARSGKLIREGEFIHEILAQYLLKGEVTFRTLTKEDIVIAFDEYPSFLYDFGKSELREINDALLKLKVEIDELFSKTLQSCVGKIFVI